MDLLRSIFSAEFCLIGKKSGQWTGRIRPSQFFRQTDFVSFAAGKLATFGWHGVLFCLLLVATCSDLHHQLIPIARQAVRSAESSYAAGRTDFTMLLDTTRELRMHEMNEAMHLAAYEQRLAELQRAVGSDLGLARAAEAGHEERH